MKTIPSQELPNEVVASMNQSIEDARKDERRKVWEEAVRALDVMQELGQLESAANNFRLRAKAEE